MLSAMRTARFRFRMCQQRRRFAGGDRRYREGHRRAALFERNDGAPQGRDAHPPNLVANIEQTAAVGYMAKTTLLLCLLLLPLVWSCRRHLIWGLAHGGRHGGAAALQRSNLFLHGPLSEYGVTYTAPGAADRPDPVDP